jgi:hypothetical protein
VRVVLGAFVPAAKTHPKYKEERERDVRNLKRVSKSKQLQNCYLCEGLGFRVYVYC